MGNKPLKILVFITVFLLSFFIATTYFIDSKRGYFFSDNKSTETVRPVGNGDILVYERIDEKPTISVNGRSFIWSKPTLRETSIEKTSEENQIYRSSGTETSLIFDPRTFASAEIWIGAPFHQRQESDKKNEDFELGTVWKNSYEISPRKGSPCSEDNVHGEYGSTVDKEISLPPIAVDGKKVSVKSIAVKQSGVWSHCTVGGKNFAYITYSPNLGAITSFEGVLYYDKFIYRGMKMILKEIRYNNTVSH